MKGMTQGPLDGLRVLELAHIMAGPVCGLMLADLGADVLKVEKIPGGDDSRQFVPPLQGSESAAYLMVNRNKRGLAIDLATEPGQEILWRLLADADVLIENFRYGAMDRLGFGWESVHTRAPRVVYVSLSGFGRTGPYRERAGFDLIAQGMSGLLAMTGEGPGRPPVKIPPPICDITAGILAAMGALAALLERETSGLGQYVDTSLFEAAITQTYWQSALTFASGSAPLPMGSAHPINAPYQALRTLDGWMTIGAANQSNWLRLIEVLGGSRAS